MSDPRSHVDTGSSSSEDDAPSPAYALLLRKTQRAVQQRVHGFDGSNPERAHTFLGRYRVRDFAGRGGMGTVLAAEDTWLERTVALKIVNTPGPRQRRRLVREGVALARLSHPNVVQVHDVDIGEQGAVAYVAMEYIEGSTLRAWQTSEQRSWSEILDKYLQAARGLLAAHREGIVHGDFKPHNVLVDDEGAVKVADFGLARAAEPDDEDSGDLRPAARAVSAPSPVVSAAGETTESDHGLTPGYCAPEQLTGAHATAKADQFALCAALFEGLTGRLPFGSTRDSDAYADAVRAGLSGRPELSALPRRVVRGLARGLSFDPDERFADVAQLIAAIEPRPARWPWVLGVAAVVTAVLAAMLMPPTEVEVDPCEYPEQALSLRWSPSASWRRADGTTAVPAEQAADYRAAWDGAARHLCRAARRGELVGAAHAQAQACLGRAAREFNLVASIAAAEPSSVDPFDAVEGLPSPELCVGPDGRPAFGRADPQLEEELLTVEEHLLVGRNAQALAAAHELHARALEAPDVVILANVSFLMGKLELLRERGEAAATRLEEASLYAEKLGDDLLSLEALAELIDVAALHLHDPTQGVHWGRRAEAKLQRAHAEDGRVAAQYHSAMSNLELRRGNAAAAAEHARAAHTRCAATLGPESLCALTARTNEAVALVAQGQTNDAISIYEHNVEVSRRRYGPSHENTLLDEVRLARAYSVDKQYGRSIERYGVVLERIGSAQTESLRRIEAVTEVYWCESLVLDKAYEQAVPICERASRKIFALEGDDPRLRRVRAAQLDSDGVLLAWRQQYEAAAEVFDRQRTLLLSIRPHEPNGLARNTTLCCAVLIPLQRADRCQEYLEQARPWYAASGRDMTKIWKALGRQDPLEE